MAAFFDRLHAEAAAEIEAAGGTVEKGLVGALLAMFGETITRREPPRPRSPRSAG